MPNLQSKTAQPVIKKGELLDKILTKVKPEEKEDQIIACLMRMAHNVLGASASSLLLLDENKQELYFKFADGPVGQKLTRLHIEKKSGIAGWILKNNKPLIVNNPQKNASFYKQIDKATGFKTRSIIGVPIISNNKVIGVIEVLNKADGTNFTQLDLKTMLGVAATAAMTIESSRMNLDLLRSYRGTVGALVSLADTKENIGGGGHSRRVAEYALMGANELALTKDAKMNIEYAALLHDIGKLSIADEILNKTGDLSDQEWDLIKKHTVIGYNLLRNVPFLKEVSKLILHHHERYDGAGYPQGLAGESIPLGARLIAVADAFDNMTTDHSYRRAFESKKAFSELSNNMRAQFCPMAVRAFNAGFIKTRLRRINGPTIPDFPDFIISSSAAEQFAKPLRL
jgi:putative nucleotidyltransferase with HDIG domain